MTDLRTQLVQQLEKLGIEDRPWPGRDDGFSSLFFGGKEFAHFHNDGELDLRLTRTLIKREKLVHPADSQVHPHRSQNSQWIELRFTMDADLERIIHLVKLAIGQI